MVCELSFFHHVLEQLSVMNQYLGPSLNDGLQLLVSMGHHTHQKIQTYQRVCADEPSNQGIVACIHRVLDGICQHKKQDQIEWRQLSHLSFAGYAQQHQKKEIDYYTP